MTLSSFEPALENVSDKKSYNEVPFLSKTFPWSNAILPKKPFNYVFSGRGSPKYYHKGEKKGQQNCGTFNNAYICDCNLTGKINQHTCFKLTCPICYQKGINRSAQRIKKRSKKARRSFRKHGLKIQYRHWSLNTLKNVKTLKDFKEEKKKIINILRKYNCSGLLIWHPYRKGNIEKMRLREFTHFHTIMIGFLPEDMLKRHGFTATNITYKNFKRGKSKKSYMSAKDIFLTSRYLLSHTGIFFGTHTTVWFNQMSYNKLKTINKEKISVSVSCDYCNSPLYLALDDPVNIKGNFFIGFKFIFEKPIKLDSEKYYKSSLENFDVSYSGNYQKLKSQLLLSFLMRDIILIPNWFFSKRVNRFR